MTSVRAQVPGMIHYQGRVTVAGTNFTGTGQFKLALVNNGASQTYWSNGIGTVSVPITKGLYSVLIGDTNLLGMAAIPGSVFTNNDVRLRLWFDDGATGLQLLSPDQRIAAVGYALIADSVPDGSITSNKLAVAAVGTAQLAPQAVQAINIATGAVGHSQLAPGTAVTPTELANATNLASLASQGVLTNGGTYATTAVGTASYASNAGMLGGVGSAGYVRTNHTGNISVAGAVTLTSPGSPQLLTLVAGTNDNGCIRFYRQPYHPTTGPRFEMGWDNTDVAQQDFVVAARHDGTAIRDCIIIQSNSAVIVGGRISGPAQNARLTINTSGAGRMGLVVRAEASTPETIYLAPTDGSVKYLSVRFGDNFAWARDPLRVGRAGDFGLIGGGNTNFCRFSIEGSGDMLMRETSGRTNFWYKYGTDGPVGIGTKNYAQDPNFPSAGVSFGRDLSYNYRFASTALDPNVKIDTYIEYRDSTAPLTNTFYAAASRQGRFLHVANAATNNAVLVASGSETIGGVKTNVMGPNRWYTLMSDGENWRVLGAGWLTGAPVLRSVPAATNSVGVLGEMAVDANYLYICTGTNTWRRTALAGW